MLHFLGHNTDILLNINKHLINLYINFRDNFVFDVITNHYSLL